MAKKGNKVLRGIVFRLTNVKEKDAMVSCIGPEGLFSFYGYHVLNPSSPDYGACQSLTESEFVLTESTQDALRLKEASPLIYYRRDGDLSANLGFAFIIELLSRFLSEEDAPLLYPYLKPTLTALCDGKGAKTICAIFLMRLLTYSGYGLNLDSCVLCGKKTDIVTVSNVHGGFLCRDCAAEEGETKMDVASLKAYRAIAICPAEKIGAFELPQEVITPLLSNLGHLLEESTGAKIKSLDPLLHY